MLAKVPPMGWNSWNTFGHDISEELIKKTADVMVANGYKDAGYEYLVIDDCWSEKERDQNGRLVANAVKFPNGMKAVADYVHSKGLKFGMYSCAGVRTCAGYPGSYDHEYVDAQTFADWGVDFLKYDYCNFPTSADCKMHYQRMSLALKASGRPILFSACNWGLEQPWDWMRTRGIHMYRSTGDITDNFESFKNIAISQIDKINSSGINCFNDMDMLTVGMYGKGHVGLGGCSDREYETQFALWCLFGVPLMMGGDIRSMSEESKKLLLNKELIAINQDEECRPPFLVESSDDLHYSFFRHLSNNEYVLAYFNFSEEDGHVTYRYTRSFDDLGVPYDSGYGLDLTDVISGEHIGVKRDYFTPDIVAHGCKIYKGKLVKV